MRETVEGGGVNAYGIQDALLVAPAPPERTVDGGGVANPVARVVLDTPLPHLDRLFDYLITPDLDAAAGLGVRVVVRFGGQDVHGWIWERGSTTTHPGTLSPLRRVVSDLPVLTPQIRALIDAAALRSAGCRADIVRLALPARHARAEAAERSEPSRPMVTFSPQACAQARTAWEPYDGGAAFIDELATAGAPRMVWGALPARENTVSSWITLVGQAAVATLTSERGVVVIVPTSDMAQRVAGELRRVFAQARHSGEEEPVAVLCADDGPAQRYRSFVSVLLGHARVVVGTRSAAFAPVCHLGLIVMWDDGDDRFSEPHAPYIHARTVCALRASNEQAALLLGGYSRSIEAHSYVAQGWAGEIAAPRALIRRCVARVMVPGEPELEAEGPSGRARIPSLAHRAIRQALEHGPVLVQVPRAGYAPVLACADCRVPAACALCGGPVAMNRRQEVTCRWCARPQPRWTCPHCDSDRLRMVGMGTGRTAEELGRAFPGVSVVVSGAREDHGVIDRIDGTARLVIATPGAEPQADGGYCAVLLLDGAVLSARPDLGASSEALRRWSGAVVLARPDARVIALGRPDPVVAGALVRWDHAGFARRELAERHELQLPPTRRCARVDGPAEAVYALGEQARARGWDMLGPVDVGATRGPSGRVSERGGAVRALIRAPLSEGHALAQMLQIERRQRSMRCEEPIRIELDPTILW